ncbi:(2Fe-2S)-binding protein [Acuticoccus sp. 2012]|uniref:(2Fe-2S)-binding protein n=1 Tax=Acuticoccus mangrovi TaxID=2796142 RepID=A0A934IJ99_9HYPH|nr:(2Fe-2S)-binding protein [Acuticoccus mangrovi]
MLTEPVAPVTIETTVNGETVRAVVSPRQSLADFLRDDLGLTGTRIGCEHGVCGTCTVVFDGRTARSCLLLAVQADGATIETIEGATRSGRLASLQAAFRARSALQCGFCTAGVLLTAAEVIEEGVSDPTALRHALSGNLCRCTGYQAIVEAIAKVAAGTPHD